MINYIFFLLNNPTKFEKKIHSWVEEKVQYCNMWWMHGHTGIHTLFITNSLCLEHTVHVVHNAVPIRWIYFLPFCTYHSRVALKTWLVAFLWETSGFLRFPFPWCLWVEIQWGCCWYSGHLNSLLNLKQYVTTNKCNNLTKTVKLNCSTCIIVL